MKQIVRFIAVTLIERGCSEKHISKQLMLVIMFYKNIFNNHHASTIELVLYVQKLGFKNSSTGTYKQYVLCSKIYEWWENMPSLCGYMNGFK